MLVRFAHRFALVAARGKFDLWCAKRDEMRGRLAASPATAADGAATRWLWHGAPVAAVDSILTTGFLRDYSTVAQYGKGTYFARDAEYSLQPQYAAPDDDGAQYLLLSRVCVGEPCVGRRGMDRPAAKPGSLELHDSMVDDLGNPRIFVLSAGSDNQAFAEFVVKLRPKDAESDGGDY